VPGTTPATYYYGPDQIGSVRRVFASTSSAPAFSYDPYGVPLQTTTPVTDFNYAGMFTNADSGLDLTQYRAYDPVAGRWLSRDPLGEASNPLANLYPYVDGNPISDIDPLGLCGPLDFILDLLQTGGPQLLIEIALTEAIGGGPEDPFADAAVLAEIEYAEGATALDSAVEDEMITLYRGVDAAHPGYANATNGVALPRGGNASLLEHVLGNTESEYTSWSSDYEVAQKFGTRESGSGVVLTKTVPRSTAIESPGNALGFGESEYLIPGPVSDAQVTRVP
jgi:RHS repeat-associated protein